MNHGVTPWIGVGLALFGMGCVPSAEMEALQTMGVRTRAIDLGWYQLASADGYRFEMPGVPVAEHERFRFGGQAVTATFYDLDAEMHSRGFLLRAFDARSLDERGREALRLEAEADVVRAGSEVSHRDRFVERAIEMHEIVVEEIGPNGHVAWVRTFVDGIFVFQLTAIVHPGAGVPEDARRFLRSVRRDTTSTAGNRR
jgi:hypothetical protein